MNDTNMRWRQKFSRHIGGIEFDAPGGGYTFSAVRAEERELEKANVPGHPSSALLKLSIADPTGKMTSEAMDAGLKYFNEAWNATRYTDAVGVLKTTGTIMFQDTHEMLADLVQARHRVVTANGSELTEHWVLYCPGSIKRALAEYIPTLLFGPNTELLFPSPSYQVIVSPMNLREASVWNVPMLHSGGIWAFDKVSTEVIIGNKPMKQFVMYVNVPHNPTGMGYTRADWERLIAWALRWNVTLIVDEAYIDLAYREGVVSVLSVPGWEQCCIVLQSVSKGWNATGLRFGWIVAYPTVIKALRRVMDVKDSGMFGPSIVSGLYCLLHPEFAEKTRLHYRTLHQMLAEGLRGAGFAGGMPDAGLCQFVPAPKSANGISFGSSAECTKWLREKLRISIMHAEAKCGHWLRFAVTLQTVPECGLMSETEIICETVRRLQSVKFVF